MVIPACTAVTAGRPGAVRDGVFGGQALHLDEGVSLDVQAGHFAVNPDQGVFQSFHAFYVSALWVIRLGGTWGRWPLLH